MHSEQHDPPFEPARGCVQVLAYGTKCTLYGILPRDVYVCDLAFLILMAHGFSTEFANSVRTGRKIQKSKNPVTKNPVTDGTITNEL